MRRKVLMGVLALALPLGSLAAFSSAASAKSPPNPVSCSGINGTVTFAGALTNEGVATSSKLGGATTVSGSVNFTCSGGTAPNTGGPSSITGGSLTISGLKNEKLSKSDPRYNKTTGVKYLADSWAGFAAAAGALKKAIKSINFTVAGSPELFKTKNAAGAACAGGEVGFQINGQVKSAPYADKTATILACLGTDTRADNSHGNFGADVGSDAGGGVVSAQIDTVNSNATL
jgi:hypothetical protein